MPNPVAVFPDILRTGSHVKLWILLNWARKATGMTRLTEFAAAKLDCAPVQLLALHVIAGAPMAKVSINLACSLFSHLSGDRCIIVVPKHRIRSHINTSNHIAYHHKTIDTLSLSHHVFKPPQ